MQKEILSGDYLQADESPIKGLDSDNKGKAHQGYMWVYRAPESGLVCFHYRKGRGQHGPREMLADFAGYLQTDGYQVYDKVCAGKRITQLGCLAHARRKCYDAQQSDTQRNTYALEQFAKIYHHDRTIREKTSEAEQRFRMRQEQVLPVLQELKAWVVAQRNAVLPKSPIGKAMTYFQLPWPKLEATMLDGRFDLDNNMIEHTIRPLALGRKNSLFAGSHSGAERNAMLYSLMASCKSQGINPREWLEDTLQPIGQHPVNRLKELLPGYAEELSKV